LLQRSAEAETKALIFSTLPGKLPPVALHPFHLCNRNPNTSIGYAVNRMHRAKSSFAAIGGKQSLLALSRSMQTSGGFLSPAMMKRGREPVIITSTREARMLLQAPDADIAVALAGRFEEHEFVNPILKPERASFETFLWNGAFFFRYLSILKGQVDIHPIRTAQGRANE